MANEPLRPLEVTGGGESSSPGREGGEARRKEEGGEKPPQSLSTVQRETRAFET
jgi:hypothetical protein